MGIVFKKGDQGIGYYKDSLTKTVSLAEELLPMRNCTPLKLMVHDLLKATTKEAKEEAPKTAPGTIKQMLAKAKKVA